MQPASTCTATPGAGSLHTTTTYMYILGFFKYNNAHRRVGFDVSKRDCFYKKNRSEREIDAHPVPTRLEDSGFGPRVFVRSWVRSYWREQNIGFGCLLLPVS